ncbi:MAG: hypothetical protein QXT05_00785 [Candidatus Bilamarchaeaceae archaeon]
MKRFGKEINRQLFHIFVGVCALVILYAFGRGFFVGSAFVILLAGLILINQAYLGKKIGVVEWFIKNFERDQTIFPGWGSACYATGALLLGAFLHDQVEIAASMIILALGDGLSTIFGLLGRIPLPYNKKKTLEGTVALFFSSLLGYIFIGPLIIPAALIAALVESLPLPFDDNITIPVALIIFFLLVK